MVFKKLYFPVYIAVLIALTFLQSCNKKPKDSTPKKFDRVDINKFMELGYKHTENLKYDSSYYYFNKAYHNAEIKNDTSVIILSLAWMAQTQRLLADYSGSETTAIEALPLIENNDNYLYGETNIYINLGNTYSNTLEYDNALFYLNKAINSKTDEDIKSGILNNIALVYMGQEKYQNAINILNPLILKKEVLNNAENYSRILDNLGYSYLKLGNPKALDYLNKSRIMREQINDERGLIGSYYHLFEYYKKHNLNLGINYLYLAYKKATKVNHVDDRLECLKVLVQNSSGDKLKKHSLAFIHINDSINKVRQKAKNQFAKIKYDSTKEKEENLRLKDQKILQSEHQKTKNLLMYFVMGIIIMISILFTNLLLARNKREKMKASYNTEIRIAKKLHDELANDVYHTMAFAETQDLSTTHNKEILISNLDTIYSRTRNIARENNALETGPLFISDLKEMMSGFNTQEVHVITNGLDSINWLTIDRDKKIILYRIIQELLVNMKKHSQCSLVALTFKKIANELQINYNDNGVGAVLEQIKSKNGLQNVENRIRAINGTITFDTKSNKGFKVQFIIPI